VGQLPVLAVGALKQKELVSSLQILMNNKHMDQHSMMEFTTRKPDAVSSELCDLGHNKLMDIHKHITRTSLQTGGCLFPFTVLPLLKKPT